METAAYYLALLTLVCFPAAVLLWFLVHPFISLWRRLGPALTYCCVLPPLVLCAAALYRVREPLLTVRFGLHPLPALLGLLLMATAIWIAVARSRYFALSTLVGLPELSPQRHPTQLCTEGIFGRIRHPRYVEGGLALAGLALLTNYLVLYLMLAAYPPLIYGVVLLEERELRERFGEEYEAYCRQVPRFVPHMGKGQEREK